MVPACAEYSRDCLRRAARRHRPRLPRRADAGHPAAVSDAEAVRRQRRRHRRPAPERRRLRAARPGRLHPPRAGAGPGERQVRRRPAPARRRTGDCFKFTQALAEARRRARRRVPLSARPCAAWCATRQRRRRRRHRRWHARSPTPTWSPSAAARPCCSARSASSIPVYPVKGYSITVPIVDPAGAPWIDGDGRDHSCGIMAGAQ